MMGNFETNASDPLCKSCKKPINQQKGPGRPRQYCHECRPVRKPKELVQA